MQIISSGRTFYGFSCVLKLDSESSDSLYSVFSRETKEARVYSGSQDKQER